MLADDSTVYCCNQEDQIYPGGISGSARQGRGLCLCSALQQPHLEFWRQFWAPQHKKDIKLIGSVLRRATRMGKGLEGKLHEELLRACFVQPGEGETEGRPQCSLQPPVRGRYQSLHSLCPMIELEETA